MLVADCILSKYIYSCYQKLKDKIRNSVAKSR